MITQLGGTVVRGHQRGTKMGFPTINIKTVDPLPAFGIYAGWVELNGTTYKAAIHVGPVPTFNDKKPSVEAFLLNYAGDAYDTTATITFVKKIREIESFPDAESLILQMKNDVKEVQTVLDMKPIR